MKKSVWFKLTLIVVSVAMALSLFACGDPVEDDTTATTDAPTEQTTEAPEQTTEAPEQTTEAPEQTTEAPEQTTEAPEQTTEAPEQTTEAPEQTTEEPETETEEPDPINVYADPTEIAELAKKGNKKFGDIKVSEDGSYISLYGCGMEDANFPAYTGFAGFVTGQYFVMKYRYPTTNKSIAPTNIEFWCSTVNMGAGGTDNNRFPVTADGEWHIIIVDLAKTATNSGRNTYDVNDDGVYSANYLRLDILNDPTPDTDCIDIAYYGLHDDLGEILALEDNQGIKTALLTENGTAKSFWSTIYLSTGTTEPAASDIFDVYYNASDLAAKAKNGSNLGSVRTSKDGYVSIYGTSVVDANFHAIQGNTTKSGAYLVMKYRYPTTNDAGYKPTNLAMYVGTATGTAATAANGEGDFIKGMPISSDGEWHIAVFNLAANGGTAVKANEDGTYTFTYARLEVGDNLPQDCCIDIAYVALAKDVATAAKAAQLDGAVMIDVTENNADGAKTVYAKTLTEFPTFGNAEDPHAINGMGEIAITVKAGETVHFAGKIAGATITVTGASAKVAYGEESFATADNALTFNPAADGAFALTNESDADVAYKLTVTWPEGTAQNPSTIELGESTVSIPADSTGVYYKLLVEKAGTLTLSVDSACTNWAIAISGTGVTEATVYTSADETVIGERKIAVNAGDEIVFCINTADKTAADVKFSLAVAEFALTVYTPGDLIGLNPENYAASVMEEDGMVFYRATPTDTLCEGLLVLNDGTTAVQNVSKYVGILYRSVSATNAFQIHLNDSTISYKKIKNDNPRSGTLTDGYEWHFALIDYSTVDVDLSNGAGWMRFDILDDSAMKMGDTMDIGFLAFFNSIDEAHKYAVDNYGITSFKIHTNKIYTDATSTNQNFERQAGTEVPTVADLTGITLTNAANNSVGIGAWCVTPGGWDTFMYSVTDANGVESELKAYRDGVDAEEAIYTHTSGMKYGDNRGLGGAITTDVKFDLTGYEGQTVTVKVYGVTNFGKTVCVAVIKNATLAAAQ